MEKEFLQKVNIDLLQKETGMTMEQIAELVDLKNPKNIYKWSKPQSEYGTRPSYNALVRLIDAGATVETLFGVDYASRIRERHVSQDQVMEAVKRALLDLGRTP